MTRNERRKVARERRKAKALRKHNRNLALHSEKVQSIVEHNARYGVPRNYYSGIKSCCDGIATANPVTKRSKAWHKQSDGTYGAHTTRYKDRTFLDDRAQRNFD